MPFVMTQTPECAVDSCSAAVESSSFEVSRPTYALKILAA